MESGGSLPHSQEPATCSYPEPEQSSPYFPVPVLEDPSTEQKSQLHIKGHLEFFAV